MQPSSLPADGRIRVVIENVAPAVDGGRFPIKRVAGERAKKEKLEIETHAKSISAVSLTVQAQVGKDDKMFGSVTAKDIAERLLEQGFTVDRRKIQLEHPIKELGTFTVPIKFSMWCW